MATTSGNVGIGVSNPTAKLEINGSLFAYGKIQTYDDVVVGNQLTAEHGSFNNTLSVLGNLVVGETTTLEGDLYVSGEIYNGDGQSSSSSYSAGTGLSLSGNSFSVLYGTASGTACQGNDSRLADSGWQTVTNSNAEVKYRKIGKVVYLSGYCIAQNNQSSQMVQLPSGYRPAQDETKYVNVIGNSGFGIAELSITTGGYFSCQTSTAPALIPLNGHFFLTA